MILTNSKIFSILHYSQCAWFTVFSLVTSCTCFVFGSLRLAVNVYMRVVKGNTASKRALQSTGADVEAISETHLTQEHQGCLKHSFGHYECFWGTPVFGKFGGVGFLVRRGSCWHARLLDFPRDSACRRHIDAGRLSVLSTHLGSGSRRLLIYNIYGYSGARWSLKLRHWTQRLIEDALGDAASRGLPCAFGGDYNLEVIDSPLLQRVPQMGWFHVPTFCGQASVHTCFKGCWFEH